MIDRTKSNFELSTIFHDENVTAQLNFDIFDQNFEKSWKMKTKNPMKIWTSSCWRAQNRDQLVQISSQSDAYIQRYSTLKIWT